MRSYFNTQAVNLLHRRVSFCKRKKAGSRLTVQSHVKKTHLTFQVVIRTREEDQPIAGQRQYLHLSDMFQTMVFDPGLRPPNRRSQGFVTRSCPTGTRDEPLRMSSWEASDLQPALCSSRVRFGGEAATSASSPLPFLDHSSAAKTLIAHRDNTAGYAG